MSEYMAGWPLWGRAGLGDTSGEERVSPALRDALYAWEALFEGHFGWDSGCDTEVAAQQYARPGRWL